MDAEEKLLVKVEEEEKCFVKREKREEKAQNSFRARMTRGVSARKRKRELKRLTG